MNTNEPFATYSGALTIPKSEARVGAEYVASDFTAAGCGTALVTVVVTAADGCAFDPGEIQVVLLTGRRDKRVSELLSQDIAGANSSIALAHLAAGSYEFRVKGERRTTGAFDIDLFLAGDVDADYAVTQADVQRIRSLKGVRRGSPHYIAAADVDRNGRIERKDLDIALRNLGAATTLRLVHDNPLDQVLAADALQLVGIARDTFNPRSTPIRFELTGAEFSTSDGDVSVSVNGTNIPPDQITVADNAIDVSASLVDGRNEISLAAVDSVGRALYLNEVFWAGQSQLLVNFVTPAGLPVTAATTLTAKLSDDLSVFVEATSSSGSVVLENVPFRTILLEAHAEDNSYGTRGVLGNQGSTALVLVGFGAPSPIDNNDFSQGSEGWDVAGAPISVVEHVEGPDVPPATQATSLALQGDDSSLIKSGERLEPPLMPPAALVPPNALDNAGFGVADLVDNDLILHTGGEGEQSISRTFDTSEGTTAVRIRYRFVTSEVPGGYFGSRFNDYFAVALRTQQGGDSRSETNSMNGLGLGAFDYASGATAWRELTLTTNPAGDTIQVDIAVANVGDGLFPSHVIVDFVAEVRDQVRPSLAWNATAGGLDLSYEVVGGELETEATIEVAWASGATYATRLGDAFFTQTVPAGTAEGSYGPVRIAGNLLADDPSGVTHILSSSSQTSVGAIADVGIQYGPNANAAVVSAGMVNIVKDALRAAGQSNATISSTARSPADQARAMFNNIVNTGATTQLGIYGPAGDAVIDVFTAETEGMTPAEIQTNATAIRAAMEQEIDAQGPSNVSRHCADPAVVSVVDVGAAAFGAQNGPLFVASAQANASNFIDERTTNGCYHIELE